MSSAALQEPLSTQVEDLAKREEDAHKAGPDHEDGENFLLCGPVMSNTWSQVRKMTKELDLLIPLRKVEVRGC